MRDKQLQRVKIDSFCCGGRQEAKHSLGGISKQEYGNDAHLRCEGAKADSYKNLPVYEMQCVDCHNRPTHTVELPERGMNNALALGELPDTLPFIKKKGVELLKGEL